jgi:hypothetical protein
MASFRHHQEERNNSSFSDCASSVPGIKANADEEETAAVGRCAIARPNIAPQDGAELVAVESNKFVPHQKSMLFHGDRVNANLANRSTLRRRSSMKNACSSHSTTSTMMMDGSSSSHRSMLDDSQNSMKRNVSFSNLEIRSYNITLGDAPTRNGPPISLDWKYDPTETETYDVDAYEHCRHHRRTKIELLMPPSHREDLVRDAGFSRNQIKLAKEEAQRALKQREKNAQTFINKRPILNEVLGKANDTRVKIFSKLGRYRSAG